MQFTEHNGGYIVFLDLDIIQLPPVNVNKSWLCEE